MLRANEGASRQLASVQHQRATSWVLVATAAKRYPIASVDIGLLAPWRLSAAAKAAKFARPEPPGWPREADCEFLGRALDWKSLPVELESSVSHENPPADKTRAQTKGPSLPEVRGQAE